MKLQPERNIPVLDTGDYVVFPGSSLTILVQKDRSVAALERARSGDQWMLAVPHARGVAESGSGVEDLARMGTLCRIQQVQDKRNGQKVVLFSAEERFQVTAFREVEGGFEADGAVLPDRRDADDATLRSLLESLKEAAAEILELLPVDGKSLAKRVEELDDPVLLSYLAVQHMGLSHADAFEILETTSQKTRLLRILELLVGRRESLRLQTKIQETLSKNLGKQQREALLREQMRAIREELGEGEAGRNGDDYRKKVDDAGMSPEVREVALREIARLERMGEQSAESQVVRSYLDLLCEMPWSKVSNATIELDRAREILDRDHYGLKKIKKRIIEHLAVMKLRPEKRGSILLFVGPPGVGKTSLGKSIAEALRREFVRVSLGGARDDADIRGHRRTYVGALPGRIIDGIRRARTKDPVFVLDEIDKVARGWGGDPASALLEALDPEQNVSFHDHYLDVPFDLSQVLFIGTANSREGIPGPLLDRMEVIELTGYTADEKFHIAQSHLLPDELKEHGLQQAVVELPDSLLQKVIDDYTREAGVRSLRRELAKLCREAARRVAENPAETVAFREEDLRETLGPVRFEHEEIESENVPGVVTGMAWTPVGGDVLFVEAAVIPGDGKTVVTGQLGDVMKESSQIAVALARSRLDGIAKNVLFKDKDIHLHVPGGAIPKDGPSAGVALLSAVASMMLGIPVSSKLAMTGEITLRGKVLPVGGIKEKVLAAARSGVTEVLLPVKNARDLDELPEELRQSLRFYFVSDIEELLRWVFGGVIPERPRPSPLPAFPSGTAGGGQVRIQASSGTM